MQGVPLRAGFGPTLAELVSPRLARLPAGRRRAVHLAAALLALLLIAVAIFFPRDGWIVHHGRGTTFSVQYPQEMHRVQPRGEEWARVEGAGASFSVGPLRLAPSAGEVSAVEPLYADGYVRALAAGLPNFRLQSEGKIRIYNNQGYYVTYSFGSGAASRLARDIFLTQGFHDRLGVTMKMQIKRNPSDPTADQVGSRDLLQEQLQTFRFG